MINTTNKRVLRRYQKEVIEKIENFYDKNINSVLLCAPTGSGKTTMSAAIIKKFLEEDKQVLFVVHRIPLVNQTLETIKSLSPHQELDFSYSIYQGQNTQISEGANIHIGMVQSIKIDELPDHIDLIVFDEAHTLSYYTSVKRLKKKYFPISRISKTKVLGLTATPYRTKSTESFCWLFDGLVESASIEKLIKGRYLASPRLMGYNGLVDYTKLDKEDSEEKQSITGTGGDFSNKFLEIVCNEELNEEVVARYKQHGDTLPGIAFCASVNQAKNLTKKFIKDNIKAELWVGDTPLEKRDEISKRFENKETQIIVSVSALCEGFDAPIASVALIARPTKSKALFKQMCGRVLRIHPDKDLAMILDFCDNFDRFGNITKSDRPDFCRRSKKRMTMMAPTKSCPECNSIVNINLLICPHCGHVFELKDNDENQGTDLSLEEFGDILTPEQKEQIKYLRIQVRRIYKRLEVNFNKNKIFDDKNKYKLDPIFARRLFQERYNFFPPTEWYYNAISKSKNKYEVNRTIQTYATMLKWLYPGKKQTFYKDNIKRERGKVPPYEASINIEIDNIDIHDEIDKLLMSLRFIPDAKNWHKAFGFDFQDNVGFKELEDKYIEITKRITDEKKYIDNNILARKLDTLNNAYKIAKQNITK